jgi:hypothetical protein
MMKHGTETENYYQFLQIFLMLKQGKSENTCLLNFHISIQFEEMMTYEHKLLFTTN